MIGTIGLVLGGAVVALLVVITLLDATRGTPVSAVCAPGDDQPPAVSDPLFRHTIELHTGTALQAGHRIELLANGDAIYPRLWADLRAARTCITVQIYYCTAGRVADALGEALRERARAGLEVRFLYDAFGSSLPGAYLDTLRHAGVRVAAFRSLRPHMLHTVQHRAHVRAITVDGEIGYTGGFGIDDKWLGDGRHEGMWRDSAVRFTGPAVGQLQATFAACWAEATGELLTGSWHFPLLPSLREPDDPPVAGLLHASPGVGSTEGERFFALSIAGARRTLYITNAYFVPDDDFRRLVKQAARRGVDVRILSSGRYSDVRTTYYAARARYEELLEAGVRIFEYDVSMLHAKTMVVDGIWATVGTMNTDNRSMAFNNECVLMAVDPALSAALEQHFLDDLRFAREIELARFRQRSWWSRPIEQGAHLLSRIL